MKTLTKIAKATQMNAAGYEKGDFILKFIGFNSTDFKVKSSKREDKVVAQFEVYALEGEYSQKPETTISFDMFSFGFCTPKGYKSTKVVPVEVSDINNLTKAEIIDLLKFKADYKINTFDPFYAENEAKRRNASAWNYIAANYISDPYCTR